MRLALSIAVAGVVAAGSAGAADFVVLKESGVWTAFQTKTARGTGVCGIRITYPDKREFYVKWFEGKNQLAIQAFKPSWVIPPNISANVSLNFAGSGAYPFKSVETTDTSNFLEFYVLNTGVKAFTKDLTTATTGMLQFPGGSEAPWPLNMSGAAGAVDAMVRCIDTVAGPAATDTPYAYLHVPVATQPFGGVPAGGPTQPFGGGGVPAVGPTQPFGGAPPPLQPPPPRSTQPFAPQSFGTSGGPKAPE